LFAPALTAARRVTPALLQRGRQHAGSILTAPCFFGIFFNLLMDIAILGDVPSAEAQSTMYWSPQERQLVSLSAFNRALFSLSKIQA
jgi:hypothetical protein